MFRNKHGYVNDCFPPSLPPSLTQVSAELQEEVIQLVFCFILNTKYLGIIEESFMLLFHMKLLAY